MPLARSSSAMTEKARKISLSTVSAAVTGPQAALDAAQQALGDLRAAGNVTGEFTFTAGDGDVTVDAVLAAQ